MDTVASLGTSEDGMLVELHTLQLYLCLCLLMLAISSLPPPRVQN